MRPEVFGAFLDHLSKLASPDDDLEEGRGELADSDMGFVQQALAGKKKPKDKDIEALASRLKLTPEAIREYLDASGEEEKRPE